MENEKPRPPQALQTQGNNYFNAQHWNVMKVMAETFIRSKALPVHIENPAQLMMIMQTGVEMGFKPMQSINNLYIVNGRVAMQSQAMLTKILESGILLDWKQDGPTVCEVEFSGLGRKPYTAKFTIEEANRAGLTSKPGSPWNKYPAAMLRARTVSLGARVFCPDIISGTYTLEEVAEVTIDGEGREIYQAPKDLDPKPGASIPAVPKGNNPLPPRTDANLEIKRMIAAQCARLGVDLHDEKFKERIFEKTGYHLDDPANYPIILDTLKDIPTPPPAPEKPDEPTPPPADTAPEQPKEPETPGEGTGETAAAETPAEDVIVPPTPETAATADAEPEPEDPVKAKAEARAADIKRRDEMTEDERATKNTIGLFQSLLWQREGVEQANEEAQLGWLFMVKDIDIDKLEQLTAAEVSKLNKDLLAKPARKE